MRGGGGAFRAKIAAAQEKGVLVLAWLSFIVAIAGGAFAADTFIGDIVRKILGALPWPWVAPMLLFVAFIAMVIDLMLDLVPNRAALTSVMVMPSVATAVDGKLGASILDWAGEIRRVVDENLGPWIGATATVGMALTCLIGAHFMAKRVITKSAGMPAGVR